MKKTNGFPTLAGIGFSGVLGGSIFVIMGPALQAAGVWFFAALLLSAITAWLTSNTFSALAVRFPESGGVYAYARNIIGVEAAFAVGWTVLMARMLITALFALGIGMFCTWIATGEVTETMQRVSTLLWGTLALGSVVLLRNRLESASSLVLNGLKLLLLATIITVGAIKIVAIDMPWHVAVPAENVGVIRIIEVATLLFVAFQGFALVAILGNRVSNASNNVPLAMKLVIGVGMIIYGALGYIGLHSPQHVSENYVEGGNAAAMFLVRYCVDLGGHSFAYLVVITGIISMYKALALQLNAGVELIQAMSRDRTLPAGILETGDSSNRTRPSVYFSLFVLLLMAFVASPIEAARSAAIAFLFSYALAHLVYLLLLRRNSDNNDTVNKTKQGAISIAGLILCLVLSITAGKNHTLSGIIILIWLILGLLIYWFSFADRARIIDAGTESMRPEIMRLRGRNPLFLLPVANQARVSSMLSMVSALIPPEVGRILLLSVARGPKHPDGVPIDDELEQARETLGEAMKRAYNYGIPVEALLTIAPDPWAEIERVASLYRCEAIVLGMGETVDETFDKNVVRLTNALDTNIMFLKAPEGWQLPEYADVLVPTAGRSDHSKLRARIFGSFARKGARRVNFCTVVSPDIRPDKEQKLFNELHNIMLDEFPSGGKVEILRSSDIATALVQRAASADLLVLGMPRSADGAKIIGPLIQPVIEGTGVPVLMISGAR